MSGSFSYSKSDYILALTAFRREWAMSRQCFVSWGRAKGLGRYEECVTDVDVLDYVLDGIELSSILAGCIYEVDLWLSDIRAGDPLLLQFVIGHALRSSLLWHEDGLTLIAVAEQVDRLGEAIECERPGEEGFKEPLLTMVTPSQVREALCLYLLFDRRPDSLLWMEAEQD